MVKQLAAARLAHIERSAPLDVISEAHVPEMRHPNQCKPVLIKQTQPNLH